MDELFSVRDQVVLVSGGSRGIGRAIAAGFAARGAKVVISSRDAAVLEQAAAEISTPDFRVRAHACDVSDVDQIRRTVAEVVEEFGRIDTLVNVAGVNRRMPTEQLTEADYDFVMDINLKGAFFMAVEVGRHMTAQGAGSQIQVASLNTDRPVKGVTPYAMSKAGIGHMAKALALEWGPRGVRVNALAPGFILTDLTKKLWSNPEMQAWNKANTPLQRLGQPEDMVGTAIFLASSASAFITGQTLFVDGGFTCGFAWPIDFGKQ